VIRLTIHCVSCGQRWTLAKTFTLYEQQSVESCPCPQCGAYTLCCEEPGEHPAVQKPHRIRNWQAVPSRG
jgi:hypothetical protein